jgi:50S ribosomal subunit-associated GTPase HflX
MNKLSHAGVFAENMLFATLDPTTRKIALPKKSLANNLVDNNSTVVTSSKGQDVFLTDTVGFISKLPTNLIAAFRYFLCLCFVFLLIVSFLFLFPQSYFGRSNNGRYPHRYF